MKLTEKNFCPYVKDASTALRVAYYCKKTNMLCPRVEYIDGRALPSKSFSLNGCALIKKEAEAKKEVVKKVIKPIVKEEKKENVETLVETKKEEAQETKPKATNNTTKKKKTNKKK